MVIVDPIIYNCLLTNGFSHVFQPSEHSDRSCRTHPHWPNNIGLAGGGARDAGAIFGLEPGAAINIYGPWMGFHVDILGLEWDFICFYPFKMGELTLHVSYILDMIQYGFT